VRVVEAWITLTLDDGTIHREQWRLLTSLMDHHRYPADRLVALYHERWQAETTYATLKSIMLDGRVLRSQRPEEIDQEVYALLTVYQVLIRIAADAAASCPGLDMDRLSFTVLLDAAGNQVSLAAGIWPTGPALLVGAIGHTVLGYLLPAHRRQRLKARTRKNPTSKYGPNAGQHPRTSQHYIITTQIQIMEEGLTARLRR
jgi:Transposase DDE domain